MEKTAEKMILDLQEREETLMNDLSKEKDEVFRLLKIKEQAELTISQLEERLSISMTNYASMQEAAQETLQRLKSTSNAYDECKAVESNLNEKIATANQRFSELQDVSEEKMKQLKEMSNKYEECKVMENQLEARIENSNQRYVELEDVCSDRPKLIMQVEELKAMVGQLEEAIKESKEILEKEKEKCEAEINKMLESSTTTEKQLKEIETRYMDVLDREKKNEQLIEELNKDKVALELILNESNEKKAEKKIKEVKKEVQKKAKKAIRCGPGEYYDKQLKKCNKQFQ